MNFLKKRQLIKYNCDISYSSILGKRIKFPHPLGIVIGTDVIVKDDVMIWQNVTLGSSGKKNQKKMYPTIGRNAKLFTVCIILGDVSVGSNSIVGADALVMRCVPPDSVAYGNPY